MKSLILDNPVFNVKGQGSEMLEVTLELGLACVGQRSLRGYRVDNKKGIILYWTDADQDDFQHFGSNDDIQAIVNRILEEVEQLEFELTEDDDEHSDLEMDDEDISNNFGWRIYTESWGHIERDWKACLAVVPSYLWLGK